MLSKMSDRKSQEPHDFTHIWDLKLKATNEQTRKTNKQNSGTRSTGQWLPEGREVGV